MKKPYKQQTSNDLYVFLLIMLDTLLLRPRKASVIVLVRNAMVAATENIQEIALLT
jgi:hypothetical protein